MNRRPLSLVVCLIVPFVILAAGLSAAGVVGYRAFGELLREAGRGTVPPGFMVDIEETGGHTLWLHSYAIHEGVAYEAGERLPEGARVLLIDEATGGALPMNPYVAASKSMGSERAVSLGTFQARAGTRVAVRGTGFAKPVVLSIAPVKLREILRAGLKVTGVAVISLLFAIGSLIILLHRRQRLMEAESRMQLD